MASTRTTLFQPVSTRVFASHAIAVRALERECTFIERRYSDSGMALDCLQVPVEKDVHPSQPNYAAKWHCGCYSIWKAVTITHISSEQVAMEGKVI